MSCKRPGPGWYCTRPGGHEGPCAAWPEVPDEKTPTAPHARPAPVVVHSGTSVRRPPPLPAQRTGTPLGGTLAPLGRRTEEKPITAEEWESSPPTERNTKQAVLNRHLRTCQVLTIDDLRLVAAFALRLRPGIGDA